MKEKNSSDEKDNDEDNDKEVVSQEKSDEQTKQHLTANESVTKGEKDFRCNNCDYKASLNF